MLFRQDDFNIKDQILRTRNGVSLTLFPSVSGSAYGLELQRAQDNGGSPGTYVTVHTVPASDNSVNGVFFFDTIGVNGQTFWYRDRQVDADGNCSDWGTAVAATAKRYTVNAQGVPIGMGTVDLSDPGNTNVDGMHIPRTPVNTTPIGTVIQHHLDTGHLSSSIQDGLNRTVIGLYHKTSDSADNINDGSGKRVTTINEATGGGRGFISIDSGNEIIVSALGRGKQYAAGSKPSVIVAATTNGQATPFGIGQRLTALGYTVTYASGSSVATCRTYDVVVVDYLNVTANPANTFIQALIDDTSKAHKVLVSGNDSGQSGGLFYISSTTITNPNGQINTSSQPHPIIDNLGTTSIGSDGDNGVQLTGVASAAQLITFYSTGNVNSFLLEFPNGALLYHDQSLGNIANLGTSVVDQYLKNIVEYLGGGMLRQFKGSAAAGLHIDRTGVKDGSVIRGRSFNDGGFAVVSNTSDGLTAHGNAKTVQGYLLGGLFSTGSHTADHINPGSVKRIPLVGATDSSGNVDLNGSAWVNRSGDFLPRSAGDGTAYSTIVTNILNTGHLGPSMQDVAGRKVSGMFHTGSNDLDSVKGGSTNRPYLVYNAADNMAENANFENTPTTFSPVPGYLATSAIITLASGSEVFRGTTSLKISASSQFGGAIGVARWKVRPGDWYFVSGSVKGNTSNDFPDIQLQFIDAAGGYLSGVQAQPGAVTTWTGTSATGQAPVSTSYAVLSLQNNTTTSGVCWFDDIFVSRIAQTGTEVNRGAISVGTIMVNLQDTGHLGSGMQESGGKAVNRLFAKALSGDSDSLDGAPDGTTYKKSRRVVSSTTTAPAQILDTSVNGIRTATSDGSVHSYSLPAGTLSTTNDTLRIVAVVNIANSGDTFTIKFGSTTLFTGTTIAGLYRVELLLSRSGATSQVVAAVNEPPSGQSNLGAVTSASETLANALTIDFRAQAAVGGQINYYFTSVEFLAV